MNLGCCQSCLPVNFASRCIVLMVPVYFVCVCEQQQPQLICLIGHQQLWQGQERRLYQTVPKVHYRQLIHFILFFSFSSQSFPSFSLSHSPQTDFQLILHYWMALGTDLLLTFLLCSSNCLSCCAHLFVSHQLLGTCGQCGLLCVQLCANVSLGGPPLILSFYLFLPMRLQTNARAISLCEWLPKVSMAVHSCKRKWSGGNLQWQTNCCDRQLHCSGHTFKHTHSHNSTNKTFRQQWSKVDFCRQTVLEEEEKEKRRSAKLILSSPALSLSENVPSAPLALTVNCLCKCVCVFVHE